MRLDRHSDRLVTIEAFLHDPTAFQVWRIQIRNLLDHRRRSSRWWREIGLWLWLSGDGRVRGIASLGAVTEEEFIEAVGRRWPIKLTRISVEDLRSEAYLHALRPGVVSDTGTHTDRYQAIRVTIKPHEMKSQALAARGPRAPQAGDALEVMPIVL